MGDPDRPGSRADQRKAGTEASILAAAERRFLDWGYQGARIEDIAADADVAVGSIYVHFGNKRGLYLVLLERAIEVEEEYLRPAFDPSLSPLQRLVAAGEAYLRFHLEHPAYFRFLAYPHTKESPPEEAEAATRRLLEMAHTQLGRLADTLREGQMTGEIAVADPERAAKFLWGAWLGVISLNLRQAGPRVADDELEEVLAEGRRMIASGIVALAAAGRRSADESRSGTVVGVGQGASTVEGLR